MTLAKKDIKLLLILSGILIVVISYFVVFANIKEKTQAIESETAQLQPRLMELQERFEKLNEYKVATAENKASAQKFIPRFPNAVRPEDKIMYAVNLEKEVGITISSVNFAQPVAILAINGILEDEIDKEKYSVKEFTAYSSSMAISCEMSYEQLKDAIEYIYATPNYTTLNSVSVSYDSTKGGLTGGMNIDKYYITGIDDTYIETNIPSMPTGTDNIFKTVGEPVAVQEPATR